MIGVINWVQWTSSNFLLSSWWPAERSYHQGAAADALHLAVRSCSRHGQVCPGGEHKHLGAPYGEHHAVAAAAGQHPNQQGKCLPKIRDEELDSQNYENVGTSMHIHDFLCLLFPSAHIYRHDSDWPACQSAVEHHAASVGWQGPGEPGPSVSRAGGPRWGPAAVEETLPVPLHRQTGM